MALGLPPVAQQRAARLAAQSPTAWSPDPGSLAAMHRVGFDFVGEVMGCVAAVLSVREAGLCGYRNGTAGVRLGGSLWGRSRVGYPKRAADTYATAIRRLRDEAGVRGADGVLAITASTKHLDGDLVELGLTGLAVRARGTRRPTQPFLTLAGAAEVATLLAAGWVPVDIHVAFQVGVRHDDTPLEQADQVRLQPAARAANFEVPGFSALLSTVRSSLRDTLRRQMRAVGADGGTVNVVDLHAQHSTCLALANRTDRLVRATGWASSIARFADPVTRPPQLSAMIMPLSTLSTLSTLSPSERGRGVR